tara:strand:- start:30 stop:197 length:168 start_codon:yes stop_codon:yes gene_type:complete
MTELAQQHDIGGFIPGEAKAISSARGTTAVVNPSSYKKSRYVHAARRQPERIESN